MRQAALRSRSVIFRCAGTCWRSAGLGDRGDCDTRRGIRTAWTVRASNNGASCFAAWDMLSRVFAVFDGKRRHQRARKSGEPRDHDHADIPRVTMMQNVNQQAEQSSKAYEQHKKIPALGSQRVEKFLPCLHCDSLETNVRLSGDP